MIKMFRGNGLTPSRFWDKVEVLYKDIPQAKKEGFIIDTGETSQETLNKLETIDKLVKELNTR